MPTQIRSEGLMLGNTDITDLAQAQLARALQEEELRRQFPQLFMVEAANPIPPDEV